MTYKDCIEKYGSDHLLKKEIAEGRLFQKEKGIYSLQKACSELEIISVKYPRSIFTGESAFYYHSLTDVIPDYYCIAILRTDAMRQCMKDGDIVVFEPQSGYSSTLEIRYFREVQDE